MTARDLVLASLRRWYVVLLGAVLTVGVMALVQRQAPVYFAQFNIVLLGPQGKKDGTVLDNPLYGLQPMVGVVATDLNRGHPPLLTGDVAATIVGMGQRQAVQVRVPNLGTQWRPLFSAHHLDVQVAGPTPDAVLASAHGVVADVEQALAARQDERQVHPALRIHAVPLSADPVILQVAGSRSRALGATGLSGIAITLFVVYWLERWWPSGRRRATAGSTSSRRSRGRWALASRHGPAAEVVG